MSSERTHLKRTFPLLLILLGGALMAGAALFTWYNQGLAQPGGIPLPQSLAGESLLEQSAEGQAVQEINNLHGNAFIFRAAAVGVYGEQANAVVWAAQTGLPWQAGDVLMDMHASIAESDSPFTPTGHTDVDGNTIYTLEGLGQLHYYWRSGSEVIWLSADEELAETALSECIAYFR